MQNLKILNSKEKKNILKQLDQQFGFSEKLDYVFLLNSKDRIYLVNRDIERVDLESLRITAMGLYFGTIQPDGVRLSIEGSQLIGPSCTKNVLDIDDVQFGSWLKGIDFDLESEMNGMVLVKHKDDFVGCGKMKGGTLLNYVPKSRRLQTVNMLLDDQDRM